MLHLNHVNISFLPQKHGGVTETTEARARVIVAPNQSKAQSALFDKLRHQYEHHTDKFVEDLDWVNWCIKHKKYEHTQLKVKNMGGRKPGSKYASFLYFCCEHVDPIPTRRTEFTADDDENLVKYIAKRIPDAAHGGRLGNNLYIDLTNRVCVSRPILQVSSLTDTLTTAF